MLKMLMRGQGRSLLGCALRTSSFGLPGSLLEMQTLRFPRLPESESAFAKTHRGFVYTMKCEKDWHAAEMFGVELGWNPGSAAW